MIQIQTTIPPTLSNAYQARLAEIGPVQPEAVFSLLAVQFIENAPPIVVQWVTAQLRQNGVNPLDPGLWASFAEHVREEQRRQLTPELALAAAVRGVVPSKSGASR